ncbi:MAG: double-strand break repair protein AddB [Hyphomicrobiaceae bacterium]
MTAKSNLFNVSPDRPFLLELARSILSGNLPRAGGPPPARLDLPAMTILLPTRRAARSLQDAFLAVSGETSLLLPAIRPIAEADEDQGLLDDIITSHAAGSDVLDLPPAIGKLERQLALTHIVLGWLRQMAAAATPEDADLHPPARPKLASSPAQAARLAGELASLMDMIETERVTLTGLASLVDANLSRHWQQTVDFLRIVTEFWPRYLHENDLLAPMERRNRIILEEARRLLVDPPRHPVIVAGVTGSIPATAELMRAVLACDQGAIVLPGLDMELDEASWDRIKDDHPEHPQHGLRVLLDRLGKSRGDVRHLAGEPSRAERLARNRLISETMRPSGTLSQWRPYVTAADPQDVRRALDGVALLETPTVEDEAEAIALVMRETAETPGRTAALVSPDRLLARRVAVRLEAWGIRVDDSAGRPFRKTIPGTFLDLVLEAWETDAAPTPLMALLKHPLTRFGLTAGEIRRAARNLEIAAFRAPYLNSGLDGLERAVEQAAHATRTERREAPLLRMNDADWADVRDLVRRVQAAFAPLEALRDKAGLSLAELCAAHAAVAEAVALPATPAVDGSSDVDGAAAPEPGVRPDTPLWFGEAGEVAWTLIERLRNPALHAPPLAARDYGDFYRTLTATEMVRPRVPVHPRLFIWGPLEARL